MLYEQAKPVKNNRFRLYLLSTDWLGCTDFQESSDFRRDRRFSTPKRVSRSGPERKLLWNQLRERCPWRRHCFRNHPSGQADHSLQLLRQVGL